MNKLSDAQRAEVLHDAAATLRSQQAYISELESKLAAVQTRDRVEKLAEQMHSKGLDLDTPVEVLADRLEKAASDNKLEAIEQAVEMIGPDMGTKIAQLTNEEQRVSIGSSDLERYLTGAVG